MLFISKTLVTAEGTIRKLDPAFDFMGHSTKFAKDLVLRNKFDPKKLLADGFNFVSGMSTLAQTLPKQTSKILSMVEAKKIGMEIKMTGSEDFNKKLESAAACIALAVISAGLGIASSLVIQAHIKPIFYDVSMLGLFGYIMAVVLGLWVVCLIIKELK